MDTPQDTGLVTSVWPHPLPALPSVVSPVGCLGVAVGVRVLDIDDPEVPGPGRENPALPNCALRSQRREPSGPSILYVTSNHSLRSSQVILVQGLGWGKFCLVFFLPGTVKKQDLETKDLGCDWGLKTVYLCIKRQFWVRFRCQMDALSRTTGLSVITHKLR